jgi:transcriptional regulator with XRE-family HTH domain
MPPIGKAGSLIRRARQKRGLSQRALARNLGTSQSLIARWENGDVSPSFDSVIAAVRACGFELRSHLSTYDPGLDRLILQNLAVPPAERLRRMLKGSRQILELQRARPIDG